MIRSSPVWELESQACGPLQRAFCLSRSTSGPLSGEADIRCGLALMARGAIDPKPT